MIVALVGLEVKEVFFEGRDWASRRLERKLGKGLKEQIPHKVSLVFHS